MPITIKNRYTGEAIATVEDVDNVRDAVIRLVRQGVSLRYSDLSNSDLRYSDLSNSDLSDSDLRYSDLSSSDLRYSDLSSSDLRYSDLRNSDLRYSYLSNSDLRYSDLRNSDLRYSYLRYSYLSNSDLRYSDLSNSDISPIRDDMYAVLSFAPAEVPALIAALNAGRINGSVYSDGECGCLIGTLSIAAGNEPKNYSACESVHGLQGQGSRPIERFFAAINKGDTPENSQFAKLAHEWACQWLERMHAAFGHPIEAAEQ